MTPPQGALSIERMCALTGVSRASYYRHWRQVAPRREETELRDRLQRVAITHRHYGYRRLTELLRRAGWAVNHKRVYRLDTEEGLSMRRKLPRRHVSVRPARSDRRSRGRTRCGRWTS